MKPTRRVSVMINLDYPAVHHHELLAGIQRYARECGRWECSVNPYAELLLQEKSEKRPDGIVARATPLLAKLARKAQVPVVNVWLSSPARELPAVVHDAAESGRMAARHLIARGFRTFGYLGGRQHATELQCAGFREELAAAGFACSEFWAPQRYGVTGAEWRRFQSRLGHWIDRWSPPIGVFVAHDLLCRYLAEVCRQRKLQIPDEVALIGSCNETVVCAYAEPSLSSIDFGFELVGYRAAALLDQLIDGKTPPQEPIRLPPVELVARRSSDAFAVNDPQVALALRHIAEHAHDPELRVEDVAERVATTRRTLARSFQHSLGRTVQDAIAHMRLERVKRQLIDPATTLSAVAKDCGFRDAVHLWRVFQRVEGISPSEYRTTRINGGSRLEPVLEAPLRPSTRR